MATSNRSGSAAPVDPASFLSLPFVADIKVGPRKKKRCFWNVRTTDDYGAACGTGIAHCKPSYLQLVATRPVADGVRHG